MKTKVIRNPLVGKMVMLEIVAVAVPKKGEMYLAKNGGIKRCLDEPTSKRSAPRAILRLAALPAVPYLVTAPNYDFSIL